MADKRFEMIEKKFEMIDKKFDTMVKFISFGFTFLAVLMTIFKFIK
jgi:uncharacterized membrane protein YukC